MDIIASALSMTATGYMIGMGCALVLFIITKIFGE